MPFHSRPRDLVADNAAARHILRRRDTARARATLSHTRRRVRSHGAEKRQHPMCGFGRADFPSPLFCPPCQKLSGGAILRGVDVSAGNGIAQQPPSHRYEPAPGDCSQLIAVSRCSIVPGWHCRTVSRESGPDRRRGSAKYIAALRRRHLCLSGRSSARHDGGLREPHRAASRAVGRPALCALAGVAVVDTSAPRLSQLGVQAFTHEGVGPWAR